MLLDWFTVVAQIVNFLILVFLLRKFLYGPILRMMDEREAKIAARLDEARQTKAEAESQAETYRQKNQELVERSEALLFEAKEEAEAWRKNLIAKAHEEIDESRARWHQSVHQEQTAFLQDMRERVGQQVVTIARQALADMANTDLESRVISTFIEQIRALDQDERSRFAQAIHQAGNKVTLRSAFEVPREMRQMLEREVRAIGGDSTEVSFLRDPNLICGIEARIESYRIAWTLDDYLQTLSESLFEALAPWGKAEEQHGHKLAAEA